MFTELPVKEAIINDGFDGTTGLGNVVVVLTKNRQINVEKMTKNLRFGFENHLAGKSSVAWKRANFC